MALQHRIVHLAARQHIGDGVTDQFADAQCALRGAGRGLPISVMSFGHDVLSGAIVRESGRSSTLSV
jgi:hypothetical protein